MQEINDARKWIAEKMETLKNPPLLGYELAATEKYLQNLKVIIASLNSWFYQKGKICSCKYAKFLFYFFSP